MTPRQEKFIQEFAVSGNAADAARRAGYSEKGANVTGAQLLANISIQNAVALERQRLARKLDITKADIVSGILEAILTAKDKGDVGGQMRGWVELGRLLGFYDAPMEKPVMSAKGSALMAKLTGMSDEALLSIATGVQ